MTSWWAALAVLVSAGCLLHMKQLVGRSEAIWVRGIVQRVDPDGAEPHEHEPELDLDSLESVPELIRVYCPEPPFVALVYHHTCGSCRVLWKEVQQDDDLGSIHLAYEIGKESLLRRRGLLRAPAIPLPDALMESLPAGLAVRVDNQWRMADVRLATSVSDLRELLKRMAESS